MHLWRKTGIVGCRFLFSFFFSSDNAMLSISDLMIQSVAEPLQSLTYIAKLCYNLISFLRPPRELAG